MPLALSLAYLMVGASLLGVLAHAAIPPLAWIALLLLLHATRALSAPIGLPSLWLALYVALAVGNREMIPLRGAAYFAVIFAATTGMAIPFSVDRLVTPRLSTWGSTLILPLAFVAVELLWSRFGPSGSWGSLAYSQYGAPAIMQLAALLGIWGITFVIAWTASTAELVWSRATFGGDVAVPVVACAAVLTLVVTGGAWRFAVAPSDGRSIRVATLTPPRDFFAPGAMTRISEGRVSPAERAAVDDQLARLHDWFLDGSRREARAGARLLVWPEQNLLVFATDEARFLERARGLAAEEHVYLAMGLGTVHLGEPLPMENKLVLVDPSGTIVASYHKRHAVPGWESRIMRRGALPVPVVPTAMGRLALAICFDADFPAFIRQAGAQSADVLLLPSNDWRAIRWSHAQMAAFRAIENGVSLVRSAASGVTTVVDPWGRVLAVRDDFAPGDHAMTAQLSIGRVPTLYARTGDLFAWCCVGALVVALAMSVSPTYRIERVRAVPGAARADLPTHPAPMPTRSMST